MAVARQLLSRSRMPIHDGRRRAGEVVVVSKNPETNTGLERYLRDAGILTFCTSDIDGCTDIGSKNTSAFVFFPDDFSYEHVVLALATLSEERPSALPVLVTARPDRFEQLTSVEGLLVVPRPVWGWAILDAIREHLERRASRRKVSPRRRQ